MNPTITIPVATIPTNIVINCHFKTFFIMIISGSDSAITDIIKAKVDSMTHLFQLIHSQ